MFQTLQSGISKASDMSGLDEVNFKILSCALLSFPFSWIFKRLPDQRYALKHVYILTISAFYIFGILNVSSGLNAIIVSSGGCYFITRYLRSKSMPWINFMFLMICLAYSHFKLQFFNEYNDKVIDLTGAQMVLVMKLSAFGWNVADGRQQEAPSAYTQMRVVKKHPNLLPFLGYVFFYPSLLTGPAFDFVDYDKFIHGSLFDDVPESSRPGRRKRRIPRSGRQALSKTMQGFFWAFMFLQIPKLVTLDFVFTDQFVHDHGFIYRIFYLWLLGLSHRLKYYTIWQIAEGSCILCGIGYNGYDKETDTFKWDRVQNIDPWRFETGQNVHDCLEVWNMNTNKWLKHYVYTRIARPGKKPGFKSTLFTFATSAFWHGTRPGYYLTFVLGAFVQTVGKIYRRNLRPIFLMGDGKTPRSSKIFYDVVCFFVTQLAFGFICQPFVILDFKRSLKCWATVYFYVPIGVAITLFLFDGPPKSYTISLCRSFIPQEKVAKKSSTLNQNESQRVHRAIDRALSEFDDTANLGVPPIDILEGTTKEDIEKEMRDFADAWSSFSDRNGPDMVDMKSAYKHFTDEINEILLSKKAELQRKQD